MYGPAKVRKSVCRELKESNLFDINSSCDDLHIIKRELGALSYKVTVDHNHCTSIVVQPITITALLVCIQINTPALQFVSTVTIQMAEIGITNFVACVMRFMRVSSFLSSW